MKELAEIKNKIQLESYFPYLLRAISTRINVGTSSMLVEGIRIGMREWRILALMADKGIVHNKQITLDSGMDKASVSRSLKFMEQEGLIVGVDGESWRSKPYQLSELGIKVFDTIAADKITRANTLWEDLNKKEQAELIRLLQKLKANVDRVLDPE